MTKEEKLEILKDKDVKVYEAIRDTGTDEFEKLQSLLCLENEIRWHIEVLGGHTPPAPVESEQDLDPAPVEQSDSPSPAKEDKPEQPTLTKAEMVSKLTTFQTNGVAIDKVMESMGYTKLSQVPADRYWELLELCQKALDGEG